jgi:hypothetical protein
VAVRPRRARSGTNRPPCYGRRADGQGQRAPSWVSGAMHVAAVPRAPGRVTAQKLSGDALTEWWQRKRGSTATTGGGGAGPAPSRAHRGQEQVGISASSFPVRRGTQEEILRIVSALRERGGRVPRSARPDRSSLLAKAEPPHMRCDPMAVRTGGASHHQPISYGVSPSVRTVCYFARHGSVRAVRTPARKGRVGRDGALASVH